ncbi:MAG: carboxylesterase family protein [Selenomonadaceae bacterium]|nr:carboxylesterase family protein [Selenomonadaceae bacterium]
MRKGIAGAKSNPFSREGVAFSPAWKKRLAASLLPLPLLLAAPAGLLPQNGQASVSATAVQMEADAVNKGRGNMSERDGEAGAVSVAEEQLQEARAQLWALYGGENRRITDGAYDKSLAVKCVNGTFVGKKTENIVAYRGIPFVGRQPVGELRWKAPVEVVPDDGVYEAYYNAKSAYGNKDMETGSLYYQDEDCLYLNVWKSAEPAAAGKKPVMVWIHGGAFEAGGTVDPMFDCHSFVKENPDVIVVTIAYRLGPFGFLHLSHLPDGKDYPDAQNLGLLDQLMALKWVHENIASFGGDPDNVTIWGESAGAGSCTMLPLLEGSQRYFRRVIAQSGSPNQTKSPEEGIACTNILLDALGCKTAAELQKVDAQKIMDASAVLSMCQFPERDGRYLPLDPYEAYAKGAAKDIAILQGCNKDEFDFFVAGFGLEVFQAWGADRKSKWMAGLPAKDKKMVESFLRDVKADAKSAHPAPASALGHPGPSGESYEKDSRFFSHVWFIDPIFKLSECQTKGGGKSYTYYFTPESTVPLVKSGHSIELAGIFNHPEETFDTGRVFDETFSKTMRKMWVQFAKTGNPSLSASLSPDGKAKEWPLYDLKDRRVMVFDEFNIHPEKESERKIVDWDRTYYLTKYYMLLPTSEAK